MKNKIASLLPHFIYKRIKNFNSSRKELENTSYNLNQKVSFYGQFNPPLDKILYERYFNDKIPAQGIAVECGAFDGLTDSTCLFFEESLGWHVFNIEASPSVFKNLEIKRPISRNFNYGLSDREEKIIFNNVIHPTLGEIGNGSFNHKIYHKEEVLNMGCTFEETKVNTITIDAFFKLAQLDYVDLFVLDVEGYELKVLQQLKNCKTRPTVFCIEKQLDEDWNKIIDILTELNYDYIEDIHNNGIFIQSSVVKKYLLKSNNDNISEDLCKPRVNILSNIFQHSKYLETFFDQLKNLHKNNFELGTVFISTNGPELTDKNLKELAKNMPFKVEISFDPNIKIDEFSMFEKARKWSNICNKNIQKSLDTPSEFTVILEADLTYSSDIVEYLVQADVDVVAPVIILGKQFYDSWGYRSLNGEKIYNLEDFNTNIHESTYKDGFLTELSSVGSFLCIKTKFLKKSIRLPAEYENGLLVGLCNNIRKFGGKVFCRTDISIIHPTSYWEGQLWDSEIKIMEEDNKSKKIIEVKNFRHRLPGLEDVFIEPYVKKFHNRSESFYIITKNKNKKSFIIYCFTSENLMKKYFETLNDKTDVEIKSFYLNSQEYDNENENLIFLER